MRRYQRIITTERYVCGLMTIAFISAIALVVLGILQRVM
jgi:hypothetical protein